MIKPEDVRQVAESINFRKPTEIEINQIIDDYPSEQEEDPSGTWNLVVEKQLYDL